MAILFDKCERCGLRPKKYEKKWCPRCIAVYERKNKLNPSRICKEFLENVGEAYIDADSESISDLVFGSMLAASGDVFLHGAVGVGKTWAMAALLKHFLCEGYSCKRVNFDDFCCRVRATMNNSSQTTEYDLVKSLIEYDKLFIDDIGLRSKTETDFAYVTFYSIIDKRQERRLPTYISTNKTIEQLKQSFDSRIASRLGMGTVIEMTGKDRRKG